MKRDIKRSEVIYRKVKSMSDMISQLLLLSRADQGREKLNLEALDFSELGEMAADEWKDIAAEAEICPGSRHRKRTLSHGRSDADDTAMEQSTTKRHLLWKERRTYLDFAAKSGRKYKNRVSKMME